jgi:hypothetical protein
VSKPRVGSCLVLFLVCLRLVSGAQDYTARLDSVLVMVKNYLAEKKPEWKHRSIEPMKESRNVSVNNWEIDGRGVRVSIIAYGSDAQAAEAMRHFASAESKARKLPHLGDGGYSWGAGGTDTCFKKGDLTIWVSAAATDLTEAAQLSREFSMLIEAAIPAI